MIYEIQSRNDLSGATLIVRFPESELDRKALYTIQEDRPQFLVPFQYRSVDGQAECSYQLEDRTKLRYRYGVREPREYAEFWSHVLQPLLDCCDWFLKPLSFLLDPQYLYVDWAGTICYLYIPSKRDCVEFSAVQRLAAELSQHNAVTDPNLENKVLKAIMQDFQPKTFLQMLRESQDIPQTSNQRESQDASWASDQREHPAFIGPVSAGTASEPVRPQPVPEQFQMSAPAAASAGMDDIVIDLGGAGKTEKPKNWGLFGGRKEKRAPAASRRGGLFGRKKGAESQEILLGAAAGSFQPAGFQADGTPPLFQTWASQEEDGVTEMEEKYCKTCLRLVGDAALPGRIAVSIQPGEAFTIGRFDVNVGRRQSDFEFDKQTKAVSRRHAAIERDANGYLVVDLASSAGTFVDGERLLPNVPRRLAQGSRVCFGTSGADYCWEE